MTETERERERCLKIIEREYEGAELSTRRVLSRIVNEIRRGEESE